MASSLLEFRLAYLRAIAIAWREPDYQTQITNSDPDFNLLDFLESGVAPGLEPVTPKFSFTKKWNHVKIQFITADTETDKTRWKPIEAGGWVGRDDIFQISIPGAPKNEEDWAESLAAYYQIFPTLFGSDYSPEDIKTPYFNLAVSSGAQGNTAGVGLLSDVDSFVEFGATTLRVITMIWNKFDKNNFTEQVLAADDASPILSQYMGFNNPWNFKIQFKQDEKFIWQDGIWQNIPGNIIKINYPEKPVDKNLNAPELQLLALTSYNSTGPAYPFSCG